MLAILFGMAGIHGVVQQSVEKSLAAELLPKAESCGSGFGVLATVNGIGDLISSVVVGVLWSGVSPNAGFLYAGCFTLLGAILICLYTGRSRAEVAFAARGGFVLACARGGGWQRG